jgi:hypothetical protein
MAVKAGVEDEKCVVAQYRTTLAQKEAFENHLATCTANRIPVEWVIDIADESNGWFYGTAYHYDDTTQMLHVMVPDKLNPSFDGNVLLDHRTVHLIECVDGKTDALFNKIVRDSVIRVRWDVEWFEESGNGNGAPTPQKGEAIEGVNGRWVLSAARYYIRMANQLLVEDEDFGQDSRGFVMLTADVNVRLRGCHKGKGQEDFNRLVIDGSVLSTPEAMEAAKASAAALSESKGEAAGGDQGKGKGPPPEVGASIRKLADMSRNLRECISDLLDDRDKTGSDRSKMAKLFKSFALDGDLDAGLKLLTDADDVIKKVDHQKQQQQQAENADEIDQAEAAAEDAWYLVQKLEKGTMKLLKAGGDVASNAADELEYLRKAQKKMKRELEEKEKELAALRAGSRR